MLERLAESPSGGTDQGQANGPSKPEKKSKRPPDRPRKPDTLATSTVTPSHLSSSSGDLDADEDTDSRVAAILREKPRTKSPVIADILKLSEKTIRKTAAWRANRKFLNKQKATRTEGDRRLTRRMLASIPSGSDDPAEIIAEQEEKDDTLTVEPIDVLRRRYLEGADASQKARFYRMNEVDQEYELTAWKITGDRLAE